MINHLHVREATPADNNELIQLQTRCPMGASLQVSVVNTPDFEARAQAYGAYRVFVACERTKIVGSAACAVREGVVGGVSKRIGYEFQYFIAPEMQRKGIAQLLHHGIMDHLRDQGVALSYVLVMEGNRPAMALFPKLGFRWWETKAMPCILVAGHVEPRASGEIRPLRPQDLEAVATLLNSSWQGRELYRPTTAEGLNAFLAGTPGHGSENVFVLEHRGAIRACLGLWDWARTTRVTVRRVNLKLRLIGWGLDIAGIVRPMPGSPKKGKTLRQMALTPMGYDEPAHLASLVRHVNNVAVQQGIDQIFFIVDRDHPILSRMKGLFFFTTDMYVYGKVVEPGLIRGTGPVHIDGVDL